MEETSKRVNNRELLDRFDDFVDSYERDMRGDKDLNNGNKGIIGEIRDIKEHLVEHPSLSFMFHKHPFKVIGVAFGLFIAMYAIVELALNGSIYFDLIRSFLPL